MCVERQIHFEVRHQTAFFESATTCIVKAMEHDSRRRDSAAATSIRFVGTATLAHGALRILLHLSTYKYLLYFQCTINLKELITVHVNTTRANILKEKFVSASEQRKLKELRKVIK